VGDVLTVLLQESTSARVASRSVCKLR